MEVERKRECIAFGIDLGTTDCAVAVFRNSDIEIISNDHDNKTTPSYVSITDAAYLVGDSALNQAEMNLENTISGLKRYLGLKYDELIMNTDIALRPFEVINEGGVAKIKVGSSDHVKTFLPEEILSIILSKLKELAVAHLGIETNKVVVSVPAIFNESQQRAVSESCRMAGLLVLSVITDPIAAAIACGLDQKAQESKVLIFDLGGGTFDVSVLCAGGGFFEVKSTCGSSNLGGEDFDACLLKYCIEEFQRKYNMNPAENKRSLRRLRAACERAKRMLSSSSQASIEIDSLVDDIDFYITITRAHFEELCDDLFFSIMQQTENVLRNASVTKEEIDQVVLVGECTHIPKVQQLLREFFGSEKLFQKANSKEAIVQGAAIQATSLLENFSEITPLSIGIEAPGAVMTVIIPRSTPLPVQKTLTYTTYRDNQLSITLHIFEGERTLAKENKLLGTLILEGIPPAPHGIPQIDIIFHIDQKGLLVVSATERASGNHCHIGMETSKGKLSFEDMVQLVTEAESHREDDEYERERIGARQLLEACLTNVKNTLSSPDVLQHMSAEDHEWYMSCLFQEYLWLDASPDAEKDIYDKKIVDLQIVYLSIIVDIFHVDSDQRIKIRKAG